jgi:hypothetical protein
MARGSQIYGIEEGGAEAPPSVRALVMELVHVNWHSVSSRK